jgi:hypothetical protein
VRVREQERLSIAGLDGESRAVGKYRQELGMP